VLPSEIPDHQIQANRTRGALCATSKPNRDDGVAVAQRPTWAYRMTLSCLPRNVLSKAKGCCL